MKRLNGTEQELQIINARINYGMQTTVQGYNAEVYTTIQSDEGGSFIVIDETDSRNPISFLTDAEIALLTDYTPIITDKEI